jgi:hypothetical protein
VGSEFAILRTDYVNNPKNERYTRTDVTNPLPSGWNCECGNDAVGVQIVYRMTELIEQMKKVTHMNFVRK